MDSPCLKMLDTWILREDCFSRAISVNYIDSNTKQ